MTQNERSGSDSQTTNALQPYLDLRNALRAQAPKGRWELGRTVAGRLSGQLDRCLVELFAQLRVPTGDVALVALGGYGRGDLCLESDVDLLLVYRGDVPADLAQALLYPLWDAKLSVGHAVRNQKEVIRSGRESVESLTSMLTGRFLTGDRSVWEDALEGVDQVRKKDRARLVGHITDDEDRVREAERYHRMDPDLKDGRGGLRTLHRLSWIRRIEGRSEVRSPKSLHAEDVLLTARNGVHAWAERSSDRLHVDALIGAARWCGIDIDVMAAEVLRAARIVELEFDADRRKRQSGSRTSAWRRKKPPMSMSGVLGPVRQAIESRTLLEPEVLTSMGSAPAAWSDEDRRTMVGWASSGPHGRRIIGQLWDSGWLESHLPELNHTVGLPELAPFHTHPVDGHLWRTVDEMLTLVSDDSTEPWCRDLGKSLGSLDELVIACLFHDVGKGKGRDHSVAGAELARQFLDRSGWGKAGAEMIERAIELHLLLPQVATREDLRDPRVIEGVAAEVGDLQLMRALAILTVADSRATGPTTWTAWKSTLVRTLTSRVLTVMGADIEALRVPDPASSLPTQHWSHEEIGEHISSMGAGYADRFDEEEIGLHFELVKHPIAHGDIRLDVRDVGDVTRCIIAARDQPGFLVAVSGVLALHGIEVHDARLSTSSDGIVVDTFHVEDGHEGGAVAPDRWRRVEKTLPKVLEGSLDLEEALEQRRHTYRHRYVAATEPRVIAALDGVVPTLEVVADDRIGLLHDIAKVLLDHGYGVTLAKIDTRGGIATDVFHLTSVTAESDIAATAAALMEALHRTPSP